MRQIHPFDRNESGDSNVAIRSGRRRVAAAAGPDATPGAQSYLRLFTAEDIEILRHVIESVSSRREEFVQLWHDLYVSRFAGGPAISDRLFHQAYVPDLRTAVLRLGFGDSDGFVSFAGALGDHLARAGVPFAVLVAQLNLLKESCLHILGEEPGGLSQATLLTVDKLTACCITSSADSYYRGWREPDETAARPTAACRTQTPDGAPGAMSATFFGMVGDSQAMRLVYEKVRRAALGRAPVLVVGETGTGKELIARAVHSCGPRRDSPFVAVNCAALPRDLIESELFGYKRGAFSGALADHLGLFRAATGGTVLLDEITEMNPELQAKLLRVVQESCVRPVGAVEEVRVDVRFIASTNRNPEEVLRSGMLRSDLYYRLSVATIAVPPLRERDGDLPLLVGHCLDALNQRYGESLPQVRGITAEALSELGRSSWPGNVRELFNVIEHAFTSCSSSHIDIDDLGDRPPCSAYYTASSSEAAETYAEGERALIQRSLAAAGGNKARAARQLGISRKKLYAKLAKYACSR